VKSWIAAALILVALIAAIGYANRRIDERSRALRAAPSSSVRDAVARAEELLRQTRVTGNAGLALRAEEIIKKTLSERPDDYEALRTLSSVYLSQHRFRDAIALADKNRNTRPSDPINYGILGDGHLELGEYEQAFDAFDRMMKLRPSAAAYARVAYARELQGNVEGAIDAMKLAVDATSPDDREGLAWTSAQLGELYLQVGHLDDAKAQFFSSSHAYPGHPFATVGYSKVLAAEGDLAGALKLLEDLARKAPTPDVHARTGDLMARLGRNDEAIKHFALAEAGWRSEAPEPKNLARFLADHGKPDEAVTIAEQAAADRKDIYTEDALAWAYFKAGRVGDARTAMARALRTGTRDRDILAHARAIGGVARPGPDAAPPRVAAR
jgi:tetratricopeptide (TPR) repeat protein